MCRFFIPGHNRSLFKNISNHISFLIKHFRKFFLTRPCLCFIKSHQIFKSG